MGTKITPIMCKNVLSTLNHYSPQQYEIEGAGSGRWVLVFSLGPNQGYHLSRSMSPKELYLIIRVLVVVEKSKQGLELF